MFIIYFNYLRIKDYAGKNGYSKSAMKPENEKYENES
jgi:hypothetical protein